MCFGCLSRWERLLANIRSVYSYTWILIYLTFISFDFFSCKTHIYYTRWGRLWDHTHEHHFVCSPPVSRLITFPPKSWLLLQWQASPPGKVRSDAAHPVISTPHRLRTSEILMPKSVSSAVTHRCHRRLTLPFRDWNPFTKPVLILGEEISSTFVPRGYAVLYTISRSGTLTSKSAPPSEFVPELQNKEAKCSLLI